MSDAPRWQVCLPTPQWHEWDGEFVVRAAATGATHLLSALSGTILVHLIQSESPLEIDDVVRALGTPVGTDNIVSAADIEQVLLELQRIRLVVRIVE